MTVTGSIGIFGIVPEASALAKRLGLSMDVVKTSPYADLEIGGDLRSRDQWALPRAEGRHPGDRRAGLPYLPLPCRRGTTISIDSADHVGQGRVWLGEQAKALGLVASWVDYRPLSSSPPS